MHHGHHSILRAGAIIEAHTGLVVDTVVYSNKCTTCSKYENKLKQKKISQQEFGDWQKKHKEREVCHTNYKGTSASMEQAAAVEMFKRSFQQDRQYQLYSHVYAYVERLQIVIFALNVCVYP